MIQYRAPNTCRKLNLNQGFRTRNLHVEFSLFNDNLAQTSEQQLDGIFDTQAVLHPPFASSWGIWQRNDLMNKNETITFNWESILMVMN